MTKTKRGFLLLAVLFLVCVISGDCPAADAQKVYEYGPTVVSLEGKVTSKVFPGPPEFEDVKNGDRPERVLLLELVEPVSTVGKGDNSPEKDVKVVQLVAEGKVIASLSRANPNMRLRVTGTLFHADTMHHRTKVLMFVTKVDELK